VIQGDCLEVLPGLPAASFDAVVTDPPYFLQFRGDHWDVAPWEGSAAVWPLARFGFTDKSRRAPGAVLGSSRNPVCRRCHKHLRGQDHCTCEQPDSDEADHRLADLLRFAAWCEAWAAECLRLLKPGGYLVAFGAPRTHHWLAVGVEAAGFEVRDCIAWLKFGGMPKSTDLGKLIDRRAGAQRRVIALRRQHDVRGGAYLKRPGHARRNLLYAVTEAATEEARRWTGWGTGTLKPVWEPALVARKPLEGNLVDNVARHGTGALHVDACRVPWAAGEERAYFGGRNLTSAAFR
jgi:site-specific DNA-methyltransferase (adenine-specific)